MTKTFHFINGMPRSGSTLLANILNQNPSFWATPTSGLSALVAHTYRAWEEIPEIRASASAENKIAVLRAVVDGFHSREDAPVVFDKSRGWVCAYELLESILGRKPKILVTYRDIPSILSSCEKLFRRELASPQSTARWGQNMETIEGRLAFWADGGQIIGSSYNRIRDCVNRGHGDSMHFINFDDLTARPAQTIQAIYEFLGESLYADHNFESVEQSTHEEDSEHGFVDLHTIRQLVQPVRKDYREILGDAWRPYAGISYDFINRQDGNGCLTK